MNELIRVVFLCSFRHIRFLDLLKFEPNAAIRRNSREQISIHIRHVERRPGHIGREAIPRRTGSPYNPPRENFIGVIAATNGVVDIVHEEVRMARENIAMSEARDMDSDRSP